MFVSLHRSTSTFVSLHNKLDKKYKSHRQFIALTQYAQVHGQTIKSIVTEIHN